jgi:hypothetical protein
MIWAASCAVFPDRAQLPEAGAGGQGDGAGGSDHIVAGAGDAGSLAEGGATAPPEGGAGGAGPEPSAGAAGQGCAPVERELAAVADTWIDSARPAMGHGNDASLSVVKGRDEQRALLSFNLPAALAGALLVRATLNLRLEANADPAIAERQLQVHRLEQAVDETRATWNNYANGVSGRRAIPGGDFGPVWGVAVVAALTSGGVVAFDVTDTLAEALASELVSLPLIVLEEGPAPPAPSELAFTSREGDAVGAPVLVIEYCP